MIPAIITVLAILAAACAMLRARRLATDLQRVSADLDQAHLAGVALVDHYWYAEHRAGRQLVRNLKRRAAIIRIARRHRLLRAEVVNLTARRDALLRLVANISQSTPLPDELQGWEGQRAALLAEVGTLRSRVAELERRPLTNSELLDLAHSVERGDVVLGDQ